MMSTKFLDFLSPPPCPHLELINTIKFMQPPLLRPLFHDSDVDIISGSSLTSFLPPTVLTKWDKVSSALMNVMTKTPDKLSF